MGARNHRQVTVGGANAISSALKWVSKGQLRVNFLGSFNREKNINWRFLEGFENIGTWQAKFRSRQQFKITDQNDL